MKTRLLLILLIFLLFIFALPLKAIMPAALAESELNRDTIFMVTGSTASSDDTYHLIGTNWQVSGVSVGGDYKLLSPLSPLDSSEGCCCTYLPGVLKEW